MACCVHRGDSSSCCCYCWCCVWCMSCLLDTCLLGSCVMVCEWGVLCPAASKLPSPPMQWAVLCLASFVLGTF
jgi:hypothetical protein